MAESFNRSALRKILPEATDEILKSLMDLHHSVFDPVKDELDTAKADNERLKPMEQELTTLKQEDYKAKYEDVNTKLTALQAEASKSKTAAALKKALRDGGFAEKYVDTVANVLLAQGAKLNDKGELDGAEKLISDAKTAYSGFVEKTRTQTERTETPPANNAQGKDYSFEKAIAAKFAAEKYGVKPAPAAQQGAQAATGKE